MTRLTSVLVAAPLAAGLLAAPAAHAGDWHHHGGWGHGYERHWDHGPGPLAGALLGLGIAAAVGGVIASQPYYYAPPPPPYAYAPPPPVVYAPPPGYAPGYYPPPPPPPAW
jgi:hypothetical protein